MNTDKITKGRVVSDGNEYHYSIYSETSEDGDIAQVNQHGGFSIHEAKANAELIAESFNVANETGKSPRELEEENELLRNAAQDALSEAKELSLHLQHDWTKNSKLLEIERAIQNTKS